MDLRHEQDVGDSFVLPGFFPSDRQYSTVGRVPNDYSPPPPPPCPEACPQVSLVVFGEEEFLWNDEGAPQSDQC